MRAGQATSQIIEESEGGQMRLLVFALLVAIGTASPACADDFSLILQNHRFQPAELAVPADRPITLSVTNKDPSAEEFESQGLDIEKVIAGGQTAAIRLGPLDPGRYEFYGEYHEDTAKGAIVAK
jgi:heme/copper-type cytochrome/quinol oxidase subunit 2